MKITRNQFLKLIPAAALTLTGCGSKTLPIRKVLSSPIITIWTMHSSSRQIAMRAATPC
mgnify:CR=1 FL=1